ncbi:hypothetical protein QQG55_23065 [Brugia pahangi]
MNSEKIQISNYGITNLSPADLCDVVQSCLLNHKTNNATAKMVLQFFCSYTIWFDCFYGKYMISNRKRNFPNTFGILELFR